MERILGHDALAVGSARAWLYMLHGIFGAGRNWARVGRRTIEARAEWGVVLVDLRLHGASSGFEPPHTLQAAVADLDALATVTGRGPDAVLGHSFGGKLALGWAARGGGMRQVWVIDAAPDAGDPGGGVRRMLATLESLPASFRSRGEAIEAIAAEGSPYPVARWMSTNLVPAGDGYRWRFDLPGIEALLHDYIATDLWPVVERPPTGVQLHFVKATDSAALSAGAMRRLRATASNGQVHIHELEGGHWLNVDNPRGLTALLGAHLPAAGT